jgi:aryl-alcohol dehydrogenase-like predicted oxidoreductase
MAMPRSKPSEHDRARVNAGPLRATPEGTNRYAQRFATRYAETMYRPFVGGLTTSSIGIGTYLGESDDVDDAAYQASIRHAVVSGINLIDTAINYRCQRSELAVGAALQRLFADEEVARDALVICTKGGYIPLDRELPGSRDAYQAYVRREFYDPEIVQPAEVVGGGHSIAPRFLRYCLAKSRQNLGLRTVDVYYLHNPEQQLAAVDRDEFRRRVTAAFTTLEEAADRGEIGAYGVATWDGLRAPPDAAGHLELSELVEIARSIAGARHRFGAVQLPINLAMTEAIGLQNQQVGGQRMSVVNAASELGLSVIASATLLQARLSAGLPSAVATHLPGYRTDAQRAIAFVRDAPGVSAALVGMRQPAHVDENLESLRR